MDVSFDQDSLSLERQIKLPASLRLNGAVLAVLRWSTNEIVASYEGALLEPGAEKQGELILPFPTHDCSLKVNLRFTRYSQRNLAHFDIVSLSAPARKLIREYAESFLTGIEEDPFLFIEDPESKPRYDLVPPLSKEHARKIDRKMFRRIVFYGFLLLAATAVGWLCWREITYVHALHGSVEGNLILHRSPDAGPIAKIHVKDGDLVEPGRLLYEISDRFYAGRLRQLREIRVKIGKEIEQTKASIENELENTRLYTQAARSRMELMREELAELGAQLDYATQRFDRAQKLFDRQAIPQEEYEGIKATQASLSAQKRHKEQEIAFQKTVIDQAAKNRFFSGTAVQGNLHALYQKLAADEIEEERTAYQILEMENLIERCKVRATIAGRIHHLNRVEGDHVREGDYVCTVVARQTGPVFILARFLAEDAQYLKLGEECSLVFVSHDRIARGRVVAIGHSGLSGRGVVSVDQETAAAGVPVKIEMESGPEEIQAGEGVYVKLPRYWSVRAFLQKLF